MSRRKPDLETAGLCASDVAFINAVRRRGVSDPPTTKQIDRMYRDLEAEVMVAVDGFSVDELNQVIAEAKAIRGRRQS